ncbi:hypothetical protein SAMN05216350_101773 [Polaromonas sp. YR568]|uniref:hypothetical protein n=1 Tax=Polaromonas sp. YR568 TaxID=1855301 RepID=UPI0008E5B940|nr:hypothetical protein [Polaromonas sp. YR568]SFU40377.1 hypothetical protein SAMN05216350_101773 [Polaromonas sp. YR568]
MNNPPIPAPQAAFETAPEHTQAASPEAQAVTAKASAAPTRNKRMWALALGTAAVWHLDPALGEMAEMIGMIACAGNKTMAKDAITEMRNKAENLRGQIPPLPASALLKVVRRAEAACGAVLDKGVRMKEVQASWDQFLTCVRALQDTRK